MGNSGCFGPSKAVQGPQPLPRAPREALPEKSVPELVAAYTCEVLHTREGWIKGCWATFRVKGWFRPLPIEDPELKGTPGLRELRHALIKGLEIEKYAEKAGEKIEALQLGEGSFARVFGCGRIAVKLISERERPWVHKSCVHHAIVADKLGVGPVIYGYGNLDQFLGGHFRGTALVMERLEPLGKKWTKEDSEALMEDIQLLSGTGFHNDIKLANVLRRAGRPTLIDYDLMSTWCAKVAVTSGCIEYNFEHLLQPVGPLMTKAFREYYDLFVFTMTLPDGDLFRRIVDRLILLWKWLEAPVFIPMKETLHPDKLTELPIEVLCRVPMEGISVCLLDLRGNVYAHMLGDVNFRGERLRKCARLPQLKLSTGIYWPPPEPSDRD